MIESDLHFLLGENIPLPDKATHSKSIISTLISTDINQFNVKWQVIKCRYNFQIPSKCLILGAVMTPKDPKLRFASTQPASNIDVIGLS